MDESFKVMHAYVEALPSLSDRELRALIGWMCNHADAELRKRAADREEPIKLPSVYAAHQPSAGA